MVDGMKMVFRKSKMMDRIKKAGMLDAVDSEAEAIMNNLDGQEVSSACWSRQVRGEAVYSCKGKDGNTFDVAEVDCEVVS